MNIIFMGTPDFAAASLEALISSEHEVLAVVTQPDKPKGRKGELTPSPVKTIAIEHNIKVYQPVKVRESEFVEVLRGYKPDVIVVVAFGQIIPGSILTIPKYGCVNIHGSLLPKYRGAAPIQWAVLDGEKETGITSMLMDKGLDTGDMLITLAEDETSGSLFEKMMALGAETLLETLEGLEKGSITPEKQGESPTAYAKMLTKEMGHIDFTRKAAELDCFVRGMNPWPSAYTRYQGKVLKIWEADVAENISELPNINLSENYGKIYSFNSRIFIICNQSILEVLSLQLEGKKRMSAKDFLMGREIEQGYKLG